MKLFIYELRKILTFKTFLLIIAAFIAQIIASLIPHVYEHSYSTEVYKNYIAELEGEYTQAKRSALEQRYDEINNLILEHDNIESAYLRDEISIEEFEKHNFNYNKAKAEQSTVEYLLQKCDYFESLNGDALFFYDTHWEDFLSHSDYNYITAIIVLLLIIPIFDNEFTSDARSMLLTTRQGRKKLCIIKLIMAIITAFIVSFLIFMLKYIVFIYSSGTSSDIEIKNLLGYSGFGNISLAQYYLIDSLIKSATWIVGSVFICVISNVIRNTIFTSFFSFICLVCPALFSDIFVDKFLNYIFCSAQLKDMYTTNLNLHLLTIIYVCKIIVYFLFNIKYWEKE